MLRNPSKIFKKIALVLTNYKQTFSLSKKNKQSSLLHPNKSAFICVEMIFKQSCNFCPAYAKCNDIDVCQCQKEYFESTIGDCIGKSIT